MPLMTPQQLRSIGLHTLMLTSPLRVVEYQGLLSSTLTDPKDGKTFNGYSTSIRIPLPVSGSLRPDESKDDIFTLPIPNTGWFQRIK